SIPAMAAAADSLQQLELRQSLYPLRKPPPRSEGVRQRGLGGPPTVPVQSLLNQQFEFLDRPLSNPPTIHEEARRGINPNGTALAGFPAQLLLHFRRAEVLFPSVDVESNLLRIRLEVIHAELILVLINHVVHLPELALPPCRQGGL